MGHLDLALEAKLARRAFEPRKSDPIAQGVLDIAEVDRFRGYHQPFQDEGLVRTLARAQHHPVLAELHGAGVAVARDMPDSEDLHGPA